MNKSFLSLYKGLPRPIYVLSIATLINGIGSFIYPFLTLYLTVKLGYSASVAGVLTCIMGFMHVPGSLIGGKAADSLGRKLICILGSAIGAVAMLACAFFEGKSWLVYLLFTVQFFDGITDPARSALMTDLTTPDNRQAALSLTYLCYNLGFIVGPMIAGFLFYDHTRWIFIGPSIATVISLFLVGFMVPETKPDKAEIERSLKSADADKAEKGGLLKALASRPRLLLFAVACMFFSLAYAQNNFGLPLTLTDRLGKQGSTIYGAVGSLNGLVVVLFNVPLINLLHKRKALSNKILAGLLYIVGFGLLAFAQKPWMFFVLTFIFTIGEVIDTTNTQYYVANNTPKSHRARFDSVLPNIMYAGHSIGPIIAGTIADNLGLSWIWGFSVLFLGIGVAIIAMLSRTDKPIEDRGTEKELLP